MISVMANRRIDPRVEIGFVSLQVANLDRAMAFYHGMLGFEITHRIGHSTALLSAGGYHPHIVLHVPDAALPSADAGIGPCRFAIRYPDRPALADALRGVSDTSAVIQSASDLGIREAIYVRDPDGNVVELYYDRPGEEWPRDADGTVRLAPQALDLDSLRRVVPAAAERDRGPESLLSLSEPTRTRLGEMRVRLLNLHKVLLDDTKAAYEMDRGRVSSNATLLQLVINDPWFAWLHPLSELVVRIDETLQADAPATEADGIVLLNEVERLLSPVQGTDAFARRYYEALQRQPAVIVAHAEVRRILKQAK